MREEPEYSQRFPDAIPCRIELVTRSGERKIAEVDYPRGHFRNPMSDDEINDKFRALAKRILDAGQIDHVLELLWHIEDSTRVSRIFRAIRVAG